MKKLQSMRMLGLCLVMLTVWSCKKNDSESGLALDELSQSRSGRDEVPCKLTAYELNFEAGGFSQLDEYTYKNGRLNEWIVSYGGSYVMKYDKKGAMVGADYLFEGVLINTIEFVRNKGKVVKEIWRDGATGELTDEVTNFYDQKGRISKSVSTGFDYEVLYTRDARGNATKWAIFLGGVLAQTGEYTYLKQVRNPLLTIEGLDYEFGYSNGAFFSSPDWYSSEKITLYDENGVATVLYDLHPYQTVYDIGKGNYPKLITYTDRLTQQPLTNGFTYGACGNDCDEARRGRGAGLNAPSGRMRGLRPVGR